MGAALAQIVREALGIIKPSAFVCGASRTDTRSATPRPPLELVRADAGEAEVVLPAEAGEWAVGGDKPLSRAGVLDQLLLADDSVDGGQGADACGPESHAGADDGHVWSE